jgi:hypothetical protein
MREKVVCPVVARHQKVGKSPTPENPVKLTWAIINFFQNCSGAISPDGV